MDPTFIITIIRKEIDYCSSLRYASFQSQLVDGMRLNLSAREMRKVVSEEARQETRGFKRSESREEKKMSFQEKSKWFHSLKKTSQTAA